MLGAIEDYLKMDKKGLFHRDVSAGNMLIQPASPTSRDKDLRALVSTTSGVLIDLDHAKYTTAETVPGQGSQVLPSDEIRQEVWILNERRGQNIKEDVVVQGLKLLADPDDIRIYIKRAKKLNARNSNPNGRWSAKDLGWEDIGEVPNFTSHQSAVYGSTSTPSFISHQLWGGKVTHEAIHDLESFWWIVVYLCLTRESGGNKKRTDASPELVKLIVKLFEENETTVSRAKTCYFMGPPQIQARYVEELLIQSHECFNPLKPMLQRWRDVLVLGYTFRAYEHHRIHYYIAEIIKDTLSGLPEEGPKDYSFICNIPRSSSNLKTKLQEVTCCLYYV